MVIKVYIAMISCSQEVKKNQQRAVMILESKNIPYTVIDITDPACEDSKDYMVGTATPKEGCKIPVTPQIFNEADYCGDYDGLDMSNECDTLGDFLKLTGEEKKSIKIGITGIIPTNKSEEDTHNISNGVSASREGSPTKAQPTENETAALNESQPAEAPPSAAEGKEPAAAPPQEEKKEEKPAAKEETAEVEKVEEVAAVPDAVEVAEPVADVKPVAEPVADVPSEKPVTEDAPAAAEDA